MQNNELKNLAISILDRARKEDFPNGDLTSRFILKEEAEKVYKGSLFTKEQVVLSGVDLIGYIYSAYSNKLNFMPYYKNGELVEKGSIIFDVEGPLVELLILERTILNTIGLMMAVAKNTREYVQKVASKGIKIYDTRKTLPGLRDLEKMAVLDGGGYNHRLSLSDAILIKENHLRYLSLNALVRRLELVDGASFVELEVDSLSLLDRVLALKPKIDIIMLDNFTPSDVKRAIELIDSQYIVEVSGGINLSNIERYAIEGVDRIAIGALTHSISYPDISFVIR